MACQSEGGLGNVENLIQQKARLYVRQARMLTVRTLQNIESVAKGLAKIPGRKTVVFMSEGFYVEDSRSAIEQVAAQAARSGITIYSIDGRGNINGLSINPDVDQERARTLGGVRHRRGRTDDPHCDHRRLQGARHRRHVAGASAASSATPAPTT